MLEITNSAIGRYKIYKINNEYYLLDTKVSFFPLQLFIAPHLREVRGYKFDENTIKPFYKTSESIPIGLLSAVLITQPFVTFFYNLGKRWFQQFNSEQYIIFKAVLLVITIVLSLLVFSIISVIDEKKFYKLAEGDIEEVSISFILPDGANLKDNQIKHTQHYFRDMIFTLLVVMAIPIYLWI